MRTTRRHPIYFGILPLLAAALGGCSSIPDPMGWFEADNQEPPAELTDYQPTIHPRTRWSIDSGAGSEEQYLKLVPAFYNDRIMVADSEGQVRTLNIATGQTGWSRETEAPISGGPGAGESIVLVGTRDAEVIALDADDGAELWRKRLSSEILSVPRIRGGMAVVRTIDGRVYGLDTESGEQSWVYDRNVPVLTLRGDSSPVIYDSNVIVGFANGKLVNIDLYSGDPRWETLVSAPRGRTELERIADIDADPLIADGVIYVCTFQGEVAAVSLDNGAVLWRHGISSHAGLAADWRYIYVTDTKDRVWALDRRNGAALWKQEKLLNRRLTAPAVLDDYVLVGDLEGYVHFLSYDDGSQLGRIEVSSAPISATPQIVDGIAYVYSEDGKVTALTPGAVEYSDEEEDDTWDSDDPVERKATEYPWESDDSEIGEEPDDAAEDEETEYSWDSDDSQSSEEPDDAAQDDETEYSWDSDDSQSSEEPGDAAQDDETEYSWESDDSEEPEEHDDSEVLEEPDDTVESDEPTERYLPPLRF